jgi:hypothetical protein
MVRRTWMLILLALLVLAGVTLWIISSMMPPTPGSRAYFRALSAGTAPLPAYAVPMELRRGNADTCTGFNLELEEGAGIQRRIGHHAEAERLLSMRQNCHAALAPVIRSAR